MSEKREWLLRALSERLLPVLKGHGFLPFDIERARNSREIRRAFPFGQLRRNRDAELDLFEVQVDQHGDPKFVLNFGIAPPEGVELPWGQHLDVAELTITALPEAYRLYSRPHGTRWFAPGLLHLPSAARAKIEEAVEHAIALYPQIETWFKNRTVGPNMGRFGLEA